MIANIQQPVLIERVLKHLGRDGEVLDLAHPSCGPPHRDLPI